MKAVSSTKSELAVPFITYSEKSGFTLNPEAQQFLRDIPENKKIGAISIVGKYRTGKSFFVNRVLLNTRKAGFQVGPTINPCTKGLWIWKKTIPSTTDENLQTILIDTQGFGGMDESANHDSRIFLFSLLLSSSFIYNSTGSIDQNAINTLNLIINLAKDIESKSGRSGDDASHFPSFLWIVRDFTLKLVDKLGHDLTAKEYLESALELQKGNSDSVENKNKIRRLFKRFFQDRDCITMVRPHEDQKVLQRLDQMDNSQLRPQFVTQVDSARTKIFAKIKPKTINGRSLNGGMFVQLIKGYIDTINKGALPNIQNAWVYVCRNEGLKAVNQAIRNLQRKIEEMLRADPIPQQELELARQRLVLEATRDFKEKSMGSEESHPDLMESLQKRANKVLGDLVERNKEMWVVRYKETAERGIDQIKDKLFSESYKNYGEFLQDFNALKGKFQKQTGGGADKFTFFSEMAESVHRLAGQTITTKMNNTLQLQKQILEEKIQIREAQYKQRREQFDGERQRLRSKVDELERQVARLMASEGAAQQRVKELKEERDRLHDKSNRLELVSQEQALQLERLTKEAAQCNALELEEARSELKMLRSNCEKDKVLHEMEKSYQERELQVCKQKIATLQAENRKNKSSSMQFQQQLSNLQISLKQSQQRQQQQQQLREVYQKKIDSLIAQNNRKSELMNQHNDWILEKSYLENQVTFLKNTLNQNKRLHDALLVALQQSVSSAEVEGTSELAQTNKNLAAAMEKLEARCRLLEDKSEKLKRFKNIVKNCVALQCLHCSKWIANTTFPQHLAACAQSSMSKHIQRLNTKQNPTDSAGLHITISQTLIKQIEQNKPFTEYYIQLSLHNKKWTVTRKYKNFCQLQQSLVHLFPGVKFPESAAAIINVHTDINQIINSKRTVAVEQRRKALQQFMRDLAKIDQIRNSKPFRDFIKLDENLEVEVDSQVISSVYKTDSKRLQLESPEGLSTSKKDSRAFGSRTKLKQ